MFRNLAFASLTALGLLVPSAAQAQIVVRIPLPTHTHKHHHYPPVATYPPVVSYLPGVSYSGYMREYRVQYRTSTWQDRVFCDLRDARRFESLKLAEGFDVDMTRVGPDWLVRYRLAAWRTYTTVYSHREAHDLEAFLESRGYQARVVHY